MAYNLLTDRLPDALTIGGKRYPIRTDFRRWILVTELFAENLADGKVKADCAAKLIFPAESPLDDLFGLSAAETGERYRTLIQAVTWFAVCGRMIRPAKNGSAGVQTEAVFDFTADAERIAAAFLQTYGIDLYDPAVRLHFWKFMALLRNLPQETEFMRVVNLRMTDTAAIEDDEIRRRVRRARARVRLRTDKEEKENLYG